MNDQNPQNQDVSGEVIFSYTQEEALEDGVLVDVGTLTSGQRVVFTTNLFFSGGYENTEMRHSLIQKGLSLLKKLDPEDTPYMKLRVIEKDRIWVIQDGNGITFLRPADY